MLAGIVGNAWEEGRTITVHVTVTPYWARLGKLRSGGHGPVSMGRFCLPHTHSPAHAHATHACSARHYPCPLLVCHVPVSELGFGSIIAALGRAQGHN